MQDLGSLHGNTDRDDKDKWCAHVIETVRKVFRSRGIPVTCKFIRGIGGSTRVKFGVECETPIRVYTALIDDLIDALGSSVKFETSEDARIITLSVDRPRYNWWVVVALFLLVSMIAIHVYQ